MKAMALRVMAVWVGLGACSSGRPDLVVAPSAAPPAEVERPLESEAAPPLDPAVATIRWIEDDVARALSDARAAGKVVLVDAWAPWCHTCLAMKSGVLREPALARYADRVVFAAVDTDRPVNTAFMERYDVSVWPTFFVLEPAEGEVVAMAGGALGLAELEALLDRGLATQEGRGEGLADLARADAQMAKGEHASAARTYEAALGKLADAPGRSAALLGWIRALYRARDIDRCLEVGRDRIGEVTGAAAPADFVAYLRACADKSKDPSTRRAALELAAQRLEALTVSPPPSSSQDDRADVLAQLADTFRSLGDEPAARQVDEARVVAMEEAARAAETPAEAMTYDYQRAGAYLALGRGEEALEMLVARERELPDSYEPPARMAWVLSELGRHGEALEAIDRALARSYGPRHLRYLRTKAEIQEALGDRDGALGSLREALTGLGAQSGQLAEPGEIEVVERRLRELEKKPKPKR